MHVGFEILWVLRRATAGTLSQFHDPLPPSFRSHAKSEIRQISIDSLIIYKNTMNTRKIERYFRQWRLLQGLFPTFLGILS